LTVTTKLGVYIQVPFCQTKCTYCNFHTGVVARDRYQPYADAVCREIRESAADWGSVSGAWSASVGRENLQGVEITVPKSRETSAVVDTIYVGGGTPSLLDPAALAKILDTLRSSFRTGSLEVTLEADPETISPVKAAAWVSVGFNRISLGAQSFHDNELQAAGRMHRREDIFRAVDVLRAAGIANISIDLIAGLAHQTRASWEESVSQLLRIYPEHVSIYMLEIDQGSRLGRESLAGGTRYGAGAIPDDDSIADFYESASERLARAGYDHYEISNLALPGRRSQHNMKYWRREPYIGFGAGAHSFDGVARWANVHEAPRYVALIEKGRSVREQNEFVSSAQALNEEFFLGLRMSEGIDLDRISRETDPVLSDRLLSIRLRIDALQSLGFVQLEGSRLRITPERFAVSSEVFVELLT
jgi:oxygen-independent coproporphyrinogen III oxidase